MTGCEIIQSMAAAAHHVSMLQVLPFVKNGQNEYGKSGRRLFIAGGPSLGLHLNIPFYFSDKLTFTAERINEKLRELKIVNHYHDLVMSPKAITARELAEKNKVKFYDHYYKKRKY